MHIRYNHPNIVSILGFCDEHDEKILVYKHASNNSLDDYLKSDNIINLTWTQRLHLCLGIARGLNHIHIEMDPQPHGDIRSANVMLDNNLEAKVAYFGIPKLHLPNQEVGMKVYQDPEYEKAVYMDKNEKGLAPIALRCVNDGTIKKMIDPKLMEEADEGTFTSSRRPNQDSLCINVWE
ncbi:putative receptor-like protein kinase At5g59700 [Bidens hawaiensis]|uniref:putative receptor-like protein kinase At5g59700 n=1 Tax=Bidens hawaiensis TaxID=980011 RepID=UPI0040490664